MLLRTYLTSGLDVNHCTTTVLCFSCEITCHVLHVLSLLLPLCRKGEEPTNASHKRKSEVDMLPVVPEKWKPVFQDARGKPKAIALNNAAAAR